MEQNKEKRAKTLSKKKKKLIAVIAAGLVLVLAACYTVFLAPLLEKEQWIYKEEMVERGTLKVGVTESGQLEYGISSILYDLDLDVSSDEEDSDEEEDEETEETVQKYLKIEEVYVATGQRISEGELLIKFTEDSVSDVRKLLNSALVDAQVDYADAQSEYQLSALEAQTDYDSQKLTEKYATSIYQTSNTSVDNDIKAVQLEIEQRTANITSLQEKIEDAQETYNEALETYQASQETMAITGTDHVSNFLTIQGEYLRAQTQYESAKSALQQAQQNLEDNAAEVEALQKELKNLQARRKIDKLEVEQTYQENLIRGENAEITYNAQLESLEETLKEAEEEKTKISEQLQAFEEFVGEDGCLYADGSGIVTKVAYEADDRLQNAGVMVAYATPGDMTISVDVTQEDIVDLKVGDNVDITFSAYEDTSYEGIIESINTTNTSENSNTVSYTVVIGVRGDTQLLYGGMTADVIFVTEEKEDVLYISRKAIVEENGKTYVYYKNTLGSMELKEVVTGISNGVDVEIVSGLKEGETIYLASRVSSEEEVRSSSLEDSDNGAGGQFGEFAMPEGMELPEGFEMPEGMELPEGFEMPEGMELPEGFEMPEGMELPEGFEMPEGMELPEGFEMPSGGMPGGNGSSIGGRPSGNGGMSGNNSGSMGNGRRPEGGMSGGQGM